MLKSIRPEKVQVQHHRLATAFKAELVLWDHVGLKRSNYFAALQACVASTMSNFAL